MSPKKIFIFLTLTLVFSIQTIIKGGSLSPLIFQVVFNKNIELRKTDQQNINLLILGIGGGRHEAPNLTDTIIFANLNIKNKKITMVSLPRDIWSPEIDGKINSAYEKGEEKRKGGGLVLAKTVVGRIIGQNIDYAMVIDFKGFVKAIDTVGGLDINVERAFDDYEYPIAGKEDDPCGNKNEDLEKLATVSSQLEVFPCRYEHLRFDKGINRMDGETALKFVRSRHAKGPEGTDFARSKRQEKVIDAFIAKVFSLQIIANPAKLIGLYDTVKESLNTDIKENEFDDFIKLAQRFQNAETESVVIDYGDQENDRGGLLTHPPITSQYRYQWVLIPRIGTNNYSEIQEYIRCEIVRDECSVSQIP
jgi:polyisoprenyl-teichoic acid--peptidoglycan teichoic acid transferase